MKTPKAYLTTLFIFCLFVAYGQEKYNYSVISFCPKCDPKTALSVSSDLTSFQNIEIDKLEDQRDLTPALKQVQKLQDAGYELFNTDFSGTALGLNVASNFGVYLFYMRKKK